MGFVEFLFETKKGKTIMGIIYGWGGAIVIIGALFKIMHWPGSSFFLIAGLGIEAAIGLYLDNFLNAEVIAESK